MTNRIFLIGGLGNQLFQVVAASVASATSDIEIIHLGKRENDPHKIDFSISNTTLSESKFRPNYLTRKTINFAIRCSSRGKGIRCARNVLKIVLLSNLREIQEAIRIMQSLKVNKGVGFDKSLISDKRTNTYLGYFQTWKYVDRFLENGSIVLNTEKSTKYNSLLKKILDEKPIIIHLRLGDYLNEPNFGVLGREYFIDALQNMNSSLSNKKVWIFSNEIYKAERHLNLKNENVYFVIDEGLKPSEILEIMRHGRGYIISNSTFGWWAAMLRYNKLAPVIAPYPWFKKLEHPIGLIPNNWLTSASNFEKETQILKTFKGEAEK